MGNADEARAEAEAANLSNTSAPPPAYAKYDNGFSSQPSTSPAPRGPDPEEPLHVVPMCSTLVPYRQAPPVLKCYFPFGLVRTFHMGDESCRKTYAVANYNGVSRMGPGIPCLILYNGPSDDDPAMAMVREEKGWNLKSRTSIITLAPDPAGPRREEGGGSTEYMGTTTEYMIGEAPRGELNLVFRFSVEVTALRGGGGRIREGFEWRRMSKDDVGDYKYGYRLFRLRPGVDSSQPGGGSGQDEEIVATVLLKGPTSFKPLCLTFLGSGLAGGLGDRWTVLVAITAVKLLFLSIQGRITLKM